LDFCQIESLRRALKLPPWIDECPAPRNAGVQQNGAIEIPDIPSPEGGGLGYGEQFPLDSATGAGRFEIPILAPRARALTPNLALRYSNGSGNGLFGYGTGARRRRTHWQGRSSPVQME
jgi:hypothetical protein